MENLKKISLKNILLMITLCYDQSIAIQCFGCGVTTDVIETSNHKSVIPSCSNFDGSPKFIMECPFSTMCLRTVYTMYLIKGRERKTTTLSCAQQKHSQHVLRNKIWEEEHSVKEIYPEDCITMEDRFTAATKMHCYCRGHLCNFAHMDVVAPKVLFLIPLFICLLF